MTSPQERDLAIGRHAVMAEAFELLANHLGPFIDARMAEYFTDEQSWAEAAANRLGRPTEHGATDPLFQLLVLRRFWGPVFADFYGQDLRQIIGQLIDTRNMWAHFSLPHDPSALQRSVLAIERLLAPVEPEIAGKLRQLRSRVSDPNSPATLVSPSSGPVDPDTAQVDRSSSGDSNDNGNDNGNGNGNTGGIGDASASGAIGASGIASRQIEPPPTGGPRKSEDSSRPTVSAVDPTPGAEESGPPPVERRRDRQPNVDVLLAQLTETESVFRDLQDQYGDLQAELSQTRQITATKQLRLTRMEQRLVEVEDHSLSMLEDLMQERISRQHIEWLIVGLLATILLFMLLAST